MFFVLSILVRDAFHECVIFKFSSKPVVISRLLCMYCRMLNLTGCLTVLISPPSAEERISQARQPGSHTRQLPELTLHSLPHLPPPLLAGVCKISSAVVSTAPACRVSKFTDLTNSGRYQSGQAVDIKKYPPDQSNR